MYLTIWIVLHYLKLAIYSSDGLSSLIVRIFLSGQNRPRSFPSFSSDPPHTLDRKNPALLYFLVFVVFVPSS